MAGERGCDLASEGSSERLARANGVGQQSAAAFEVFAQARALGVAEMEILAAVHEDDVVTEQAWVGDVDQLGRGADLKFKVTLRAGAQEVEERAGGVVAAAAVAELCHFDDAAGPIRRGELAVEGRV